MTKNKEEWITAEELMARLEADPSWVADRDRRHAEHQKRVEDMHAALVPLHDALRAAGCSLSPSNGTLTNQPNIPTAIRILIDHLQRTTYPTDAREYIASALNVPEVKAHWNVLLQLYRDEREQRVKEELAGAIVAATNAAVFDEVLALVRDKNQGPSRVLLLTALERSKDPRVRPTLIELATDLDLIKEIPFSLRRLEKRASRKKPPKQVTH